MALYVVTVNGNRHANRELYMRGVAGSYANLDRLFAARQVETARVLGEVLYRLDDAQYAGITQVYAPQEQDFDAMYKAICVIPKERFAEYTVIKVPRVKALPVMDFGRISFVRLSDFEVPRGNKYTAFQQMAKVRVCWTWYIALDAITAGTERPIIVTAGE